MVYRYSRWDGSQEIGPFDADELLDSLAEDLLDDGDLQRALERMMRWGGQGPMQDQIKGIDRLLEQLRARRQQELRRNDVDSIVEDLKQRLDQVVQTERSGIEKRLEHAREQTDPQTQSLRQTLEKMAARKQEFLDQLPPDLGGSIKALSDYDFMDPEARQQFQDLLQMLQQQLLQSHFKGLQQAIQNLTPEDLQRTREMVRDLNRMLEEKMQGKQPDFQGFMQKYGDFFPPGINSLEELIHHLQQQASQMQSLLNSMSPEMRQSLMDMMDSALRDDRLRWDLAQLAANLEQLHPMRRGRQYPFEGDEPLTLAEAMQLMDQLQGMDQLEKDLKGVRRLGDLDHLDADRVRDLLGEEAANNLERLKQITKLLEEAGYINKQGNRYELTPRAIRRIGQKALRDIFTHLKRDRTGQHEMDHRGTAGDRSDDSKPYEFGDPFLLDLEQTLMNSLVREGPGSPVRLAPSDFEVYRTEHLTQSSTVLLLDMSRSMWLRGCFQAAKRVALALASLIRTQFPRDHLYIIGFSFLAEEVKPEELPRLSWEEHMVGTNMQHAFMLARQLLARHKGGNRQVILITDGEPTAHLDDSGTPYFNYPPTPETIQETLREVKRCTREGIVINTFMMEQGRELEAFVNQMARINRGRAFFATPDRLGQYILVDYVSNKRKMVG